MSLLVQFHCLVFFFYRLVLILLQCLLYLGKFGVGSKMDNNNSTSSFMVIF